MTTPSCPLCRAPMHFTANPYARVWVCSRTGMCAGAVPLADDDALTTAQLAQAIMRLDGETHTARTAYQQVHGPLTATAASPYLTRAERATLQTALTILRTLSDAEVLAADPVAWAEAHRQDVRECRQHEALSVLGRYCAPRPLELVPSMTDLLALDRASGAGLFARYLTIEAFTAPLVATGLPPIDALIPELFRYYADLTTVIASQWNACDTPLEALEATLAVAVAAHRQNILADPPIPLQATRRLLQPDPCVIPFPTARRRGAA